MTETTAKPTKKPHRKGAGRVAFLARLETIREKLIDQGHPQIEVYEDYKEELGISYSQFNRYVLKYIGNVNDEHQKRRNPTLFAEKKDDNEQPTRKPVSQNETRTTERTTEPTKPGAKPGFSYDPTTRRDDLV